MNIRRHWAYLKYVLRHKLFVLLAGIRLGVPLWILILHDWDKFKPDEWFAYARCFYKPDGSKQYVDSVEFAHAWMLHQHRNKHHWQYWLWIEYTTNNCQGRLRESDYLMWDRGELQRVVTRNSGGTEWFELREPYPGDRYSGAIPMPDLFRREMLADWRGAGRALGKPDTLAWYTKERDKMKLHPETRAWIEKQLNYQS